DDLVVDSVGIPDAAIRIDAPDVGERASHLDEVHERRTIVGKIEGRIVALRIDMRGVLVADDADREIRAHSRYERPVSNAGQERSVDRTRAEVPPQAGSTEPHRHPGHGVENSFVK